MDQERAIRQLEELKRLGSVMRLAAEEWKSPFQTLIAIILSARTRDEVTIVVGEKLFEKYPTADALSKARESEVSAIVRPVNFYRNKTKSIIGCARMLNEKYSGVPPHDIDKLVELPGVGRKTASVFLSEMGREAVGVDTHVSYISQRLGWVKSARPDKIEEELKELFPQHYWSKINVTLVHFGKTYISRRKKDMLLEQIKNMS